MIESGAPVAGFDPFELPDTIQLGTADDPYPHLAAARRKGPVQLEWPLRHDVGTVDEDRDPSFNVLGHDEVMTVLRDHETYSSQILTEIMGPVLDHTMMDAVVVRLLQSRTTTSTRETVARAPEDQQAEHVTHQATVLLPNHHPDFYSSPTAVAPTPRCSASCCCCCCPNYSSCTPLQDVYGRERERTTELQSTALNFLSPFYLLISIQIDANIYMYVQADGGGAGFIFFSISRFPVAGHFAVVIAMRPAIAHL